MTSQRPDPTEPFDAFEMRLAARVTRHAERGVRPIDAGRIAHESAIAGTGAGTGRARAGATLGGRLGWLLAGAVLAAGLIGGASWAGSHGLLGVAPSPSPTLLADVPTDIPSLAPPSESATAAAPTPRPTAAPIEACRMAALAARVTAWNGAAGNRIGTIVLSNHGTVACKLQVTDRPQLVDGAGTVLIDGDAPSHPGSIEVAAGATVTTEVDAANYCGPAAPAPVTVAFEFSNGDRLLATALSAADTSGLPDCMGPGSPGMISMHPWAP